MFFYVFKGGGAAVYSPEFSRGSLTAVFNAYIWQVLSSPTLTITVEGRADSDTSWATVNTFSSITTVGAKTASMTGLPQLLRYKFEVAGGTDLSGVAIELLAPTWLP